MRVFPITCDRAKLTGVPALAAVRTDFAARLRASREAITINGKPMSKAEFIRRLNAEAASTYNDGNARSWEREDGTAMPNARAVASIAVVLGVSTDYLLGLDDDPSPRWISPEEEAARRAVEVAEAGP